MDIAKLLIIVMNTDKLIPILLIVGMYSLAVIDPELRPAFMTLATVSVSGYIAWKTKHQVTTGSQPTSQQNENSYSEGSTDEDSHSST